MGVIHEETEAQLDPQGRPEIDRETHLCRGRDRDMEIKRQTERLEGNVRRDGQAQRKMGEKGQVDTRTGRHTDRQTQRENWETSCPGWFFFFFLSVIVVVWSGFFGFVLLFVNLAQVSEEELLLKICFYHIACEILP